MNRRGTLAMGQRMLRVAQDYLNWGIGGQGTKESEMGREAQTAQIDTVKATCNGESSNKNLLGQNSKSSK